MGPSRDVGHRGVTLPQSVPSASEVQATYAATLFDEWIRLGLRDVVLCPGSRSTPLALACTARAELRVHVGGRHSRLDLDVIAHEDDASEAVHGVFHGLFLILPLDVAAERHPAFFDFQLSPFSLQLLP